ncbi:MAG TPA: ABC transporter permease [Cyclobacteriaceae bacterium]|nr:ABC transporter permease [Cyclobacteriaceae bacterium]
MFKSILTTALRNLTRQRAFSIINLLGLSVGMSLALLIIMIVKDQFTFDNFHNNADRIYRINTRALRTNGGTEPYASAPLALAKVMAEDYTYSEKVVRINRQFSGDAIYGSVNIPLGGFMADQSFFEVFNFPFEKGDPATALKDPKGIVLTQVAAEKLFGRQEPLGQTISFGKLGEFHVTGVLKPFISKTHFEFEVVGSMEALPAYEKAGLQGASLENWNNYYAGYVYLKLKEGHTTQEVDRSLAEISSKYYAGLKLETRDKGYEFYLDPLPSITPGPSISNRMGNGVPDTVLVFMGVLVAVVMIMACFNYTNLMIAKSLTRAREIGVRKVMGAQRLQVFTQFVGESTVFALVALALSYVLLQLLKPAFMQLSLARSFDITLGEDVSLYLYFLAFAIGIGIIAGLLPAGYLSAFKPIKVLKDSGGMKVYSRMVFRKALIVTQFSLSIVFIIVVLVIYNQIDYTLNKDYGINEANTINVRLQGMGFEKLAGEASKISDIVRIGGVSHQLGTWADRSSDYKRNLADEPFGMRDFIVDNNYIDNLELSFIAGGNFDPSLQGERERHVILNETALPLFGFTDPVSAMGQTLYTDDSLMLTVTGVVKDFHFRPLSYKIGPLALRYKIDEIGFLSARIVPGEKEKVKAQLEVVWKRLDPVHPFQARMMDEEIDEAYTRGGFTDLLKVIGYVCFIAITLACLGMLGMAMYSTQTRIKEIGIRKVMGADATQVVMVLSRSFLWLITIAIVIGLPAGYVAGGMFLENYAYRIPISFTLMFSGVITIVILGTLTIASQTWKAAIVNPVNSLRYE